VSRDDDLNGGPTVAEDSPRVDIDGEPDDVDEYACRELAILLIQEERPGHQAIFSLSHTQVTLIASFALARNDSLEVDLVASIRRCAKERFWGRGTCKGEEFASRGIKSLCRGTVVCVTEATSDCVGGIN